MSVVRPETIFLGLQFHNPDDHENCKDRCSSGNCEGVPFFDVILSDGYTLANLFEKGIVNSDDEDVMLQPYHACREHGLEIVSFFTTKTFELILEGDNDAGTSE